MQLTNLEKINISVDLYVAIANIRAFSYEEAIVILNKEIAKNIKDKGLL